jgi:hypothetical protein
MKTPFHLSIVLAGLLGCCSGARAADTASTAQNRQTIVPVRHGVHVKETTGTVEYAYDSTGWRTLSAGKHLKAGATIRAAAGATAIVRVDQRPSFVKISSATSLHITPETPAEENAHGLLAIAGVSSR